MTKKQLVFSGIRPSGRLHIGNYLGAVKNFIELQNTHDCIFSVVDYHGITTPFNTNTLQKDIFNVVLDYLAAGLNPKKCHVMIQSSVPEHLGLAWILGSITPISWLERIPTYKEKITLHPKYINLGLLSYPVLMAADILIYKATLVPVGEDQLPHIELTNQIAKRFNKMFGQTFPEVKPFLSQGARIMSLTGPTKKMSKTGDEGIGLSDSPEIVRKKINRAVTDSGHEVTSGPNKPALTNLLTIYHLFSEKSIKDLEKKYKGKGYADFKKDLSGIVINALEPFQKKSTELEKKPKYIKKVLEDGARYARTIARKTLAEVKKKTGLI